MFNLGWSKSITTGVTVQVVKVKRFLTRKIKTSEYCPLLHPTSVLYFLPLLSTHTYLSFFPSHLISMFTRWRDFSLHLGRLAVQGCPFCIQDIRMKWELDRHTSPPPHCPSFLSRAKKETWLRDVLWWLLLRFGTSLSWVLRLKRWWMGFQLNVPDRQMKPFSFTFCVSSTDDSVPSSDSLSDSSPPAPGVPTQVVQSVQTTPQVRCTHIFIMMGIPLYVGDNVDTNEHTTHTVGLLFDQDLLEWHSRNTTRNFQLSIWRSGFIHQQRSVLQAVSQAAKRNQTGHVNNLQSVHITPEVRKIIPLITSSACQSCHTTYIDLQQHTAASFVSLVVILNSLLSYN